jgi:hypothetical protein
MNLKSGMSDMVRLPQEIHSYLGERRGSLSERS